MIFDLPGEWQLEGGTVVAGVDIGGTQCSVNIATVSAGTFELVVRDQFPTLAARGPDEIISEIEQRLAKALDATRRPAVVGVSCGGPLDPETGVIQSPPNLPGWDDVPLTSRLEGSLGIRCVLENDANAGALAERAFGAARGAKDVVYLTFGTGLGAGMILGGASYGGAGGLAGEVGHWRVGADSGPLNYGKRGTFQGFCSGNGLVEWYEHWGGRHDGAAGPSAELIARWAREGDLLAERVFDQAARHLGRGVALLVDAFAPEVVVIGGIFVYANDLLQAGMDGTLREEAHAKLLANCRVVPAGLGAHVGSIASCCVGLDRLIREPLVDGAPEVVDAPG